MFFGAVGIKSGPEMHEGVSELNKTMSVLQPMRRLGRLTIEKFSNSAIAAYSISSNLNSPTAGQELLRYLFRPQV
jgi:hypothetical protein